MRRAALLIVALVAVVTVLVRLDISAGRGPNAANHAEAIERAERSVALQESRLGPNHPEVATSLNDLAELYRATGQYARARRLHERSLAIRESQLGREHPHVATSLNNLALVYSAIGNYAEALPLQERGLAIVEKAYGREHPVTALSLNNLAELHRATGEYGKALLLQERSLAIDEKMHGREHPDVARGLNNLASIYEDTGEYAKALPLFQRSLAIFEKVHGREHPELAVTLDNLGALYRTMGEYAKALPLHERSLAVFEASHGKQHPAVATSLNNLALLYRTMGEHANALPLYERSLAIRERLHGPEHPLVATSLNNLGVLHRAMGEYAGARAAYERSLAIYEKAYGPEHPDVALALHNLSGLYLALGEPGKALPLSERSLVIRERWHGRAHPAVAMSLNNLALLHLATAEHTKARRFLQESLQIAEASGVRELVWRAQAGLRNALAREERPELAIFFGKQAVNSIQSMRAGLTALERDLQRLFLHGKQREYRSLVELLIDQGRLAEAQQVLAMLKEEEFFDFIRRDATTDPRATQVPLTAQEEAWHRRYLEVSDRLGALGVEHEQLRRRAQPGLSEAEQKRRDEVEADLRAARFAFDQFLRQLVKEAEQAGAPRAREVGERGLANLPALRGTLASLGEGVVALHYVMGEDRLSILLTTSSMQVARAVPATSADLNHKVKQFRERLQNPGSDPLPAARELYEALIAPVARDLKQARARTLMVSLDGALRYLPFAALHDGKRYLVEDYLIVIFTEAAKDKLQDAPQAQWRFAGLGLTRPVKSFSALPGVKAELEGIVRKGDRGVLPGEVHLDHQFTAKRIRDALDRAYPVLHVASHFVLRPGNETRSFLLLGDESELSLRELKHYDFRNLDLLALSACETAVGGGQDDNGLEIESFGVLARTRGARGVLATLWRVADASTAILMQDLYRLREAHRLTKAEALRQAQLRLLHGGGSHSGVAAHARGLEPSGPGQAAPADPARPYAHPYYWAPFILMGNWL